MTRTPWAAVSDLEVVQRARCRYCGRVFLLTPRGQITHRAFFPDHAELFNWATGEEKGVCTIGMRVPSIPELLSEEGTLL